MAFPDFSYCIICEIVRPELGGKFILLGFYGLAPNVEILIPDLNRPVFLSVLAGSPPVDDANTSYDLMTTVSRPDGITIFQTPPHRLVVSQGKGVAVPLGFSMAPPILTGLYSVRLAINGETKLETTFALRPSALPPFDQNRQVSKTSAPN